MSLISRRYLLWKLSILCLLAFTGLLLARSSGPDPGYTGGLGDRLCIACHTDSDPHGGSLAIMAPSSYNPDTDYTITVTLTQPGGARRWGFQLAARFEDGRQAGSLAPGADGLTRVQVSDTGVQYISHNFQGTHPGEGGPVSWTFTWHSPGAGSGPVQFHAAGNASGPGGPPTTARIYTSQAASTPAGGAPNCNDLPIITHFAQFANGSGVTSRLTINNTGSTPLNACLELRDDVGSLWNPTMVSQPAGISPGGVFTIGGKQQVTLTSDGQGELTTGSIRVRSDAAIGGDVLFRIPNIGETAVTASAPMTGFMVTAERNPDIDTGLAMVNTEDSPVTINMTLRRQDGTVVGTNSISLVARGHRSAFIDELLPDADTSTFMGTFEAQVIGGSVGAIAVRLSNPGASTPVFSTLSVVPLP